MYRGATISQTELERLRLIENVVRQGRVAHIGDLAASVPLLAGIAL